MPDRRSISAIAFVLTARCNFHCSYCYQNVKTRRSMDRHTLEAAVAFGLNLDSRRLEFIFLGGEPLLEWPLLCRAVELGEKRSSATKRLNYAVFTNGVLVTDEIASFLEAHDFRTLLSFDGIKQAQDYRKRGTFSALDRLLGMLSRKNANWFERRVTVCITVIPATLRYLSESVRYLLDKGVSSISVGPCIVPFPADKDTWMSELDDQFATLHDVCQTHLHRTGKVPLMLFRKTAQRRRPTKRDWSLCGVANARTILIDVDGQAYGCALFTESYQKYPSKFLKTRMESLRMGDFRDPSFWERYAAFPAAVRRAEIFHHKEKKYSSYGKCGDCEYLDECSVCPVSIGYDPANADPHRIPDWICGFNQVALKHRKSFPTMHDSFRQFRSSAELEYPFNKFEAYLRTARQRH